MSGYRLRATNSDKCSCEKPQSDSIISIYSGANGSLEGDRLNRKLVMLNSHGGGDRSDFAINPSRLYKKKRKESQLRNEINLNKPETFKRMHKNTSISKDVKIIHLNTDFSRSNARYKFPLKRESLVNLHLTKKGVKRNNYKLRNYDILNNGPCKTATNFRKQENKLRHKGANDFPNLHKSKHSDDINQMSYSFMDVDNMFTIRNKQRLRQFAKNKNVLTTSSSLTSVVKNYSAQKRDLTVKKIPRRSHSHSIPNKYKHRSNSFTHISNHIYQNDPRKKRRTLSTVPRVRCRCGEMLSVNENRRKCLLNYLNYAFAGLLVVVSSPCLLVGTLASIIIWPMKTMKLLYGLNFQKRTPLKFLLNRVKKVCTVHKSEVGRNSRAIGTSTSLFQINRKKLSTDASSTFPFKYVDSNKKNYQQREIDSLIKPDSLTENALHMYENETRLRQDSSLLAKFLASPQNFEQSEVHNPSIYLNHGCFPNTVAAFTCQVDNPKINLEKKIKKRRQAKVNEFPRVKGEGFFLGSTPKSEQLQVEQKRQMSKIFKTSHPCKLNVPQNHQSSKIHQKTNIEVGLSQGGLQNTKTCPYITTEAKVNITSEKHNISYRPKILSSCMHRQRSALKNREALVYQKNAPYCLVGALNYVLPTHSSRSQCLKTTEQKIQKLLRDCEQNKNFKHTCISPTRHQQTYLQNKSCSIQTINDNLSFTDKKMKINVNTSQGKFTKPIFSTQSKIKTKLKYQCLKCIDSSNQSTNSFQNYISNNSKCDSSKTINKQTVPIIHRYQSINLRNQSRRNPRQFDTIYYSKEDKIGISKQDNTFLQSRYKAKNKNSCPNISFPEKCHNKFIQTSSNDMLRRISNTNRWKESDTRKLNRAQVKSSTQRKSSYLKKGQTITEEQLINCNCKSLSKEYVNKKNRFDIHTRCNCNERNNIIPLAFPKGKFQPKDFQEEHKCEAPLKLNNADIYQLCNDEASEGVLKQEFVRCDCFEESVRFFKQSQKRPLGVSTRDTRSVKNNLCNWLPITQVACSCSEKESSPNKLRKCLPTQIGKNSSEYFENESDSNLKDTNYYEFLFHEICPFLSNIKVSQEKNLQRNVPRRIQSYQTSLKSSSSSQITSSDKIVRDQIKERIRNIIMRSYKY